MSQTSYSLTTAAAIAGMKADAGFDYVESHPAAAQVDFGLGVVQAQTDLTAVRRPLINTSAVVLDADLITANTLSFDLVVDGVTTVISVLFATSHLATMQAAEAAVEAVDGVLSATVGGAGNRTLTIVGENVTVTVNNAIVTGGASQAGVVVTASSGDTAATVRGIALHEQKESLVGYETLDSVNTLRRGKAWVPVVDTIADGDDVYISYAAGSEGKFRNDSTNSIQVTGAKFRSAATTGQLAVVEINQP